MDKNIKLLEQDFVGFLRRFEDMVSSGRINIEEIKASAIRNGAGYPLYYKGNDWRIPNFPAAFKAISMNSPEYLRLKAFLEKQGFTLSPSANQNSVTVYVIKKF